MFLTWQLWRALNHPPRRHPVFQYVLTHAQRNRPRVAPGFFLWAFMCSGFTFFWTIIFEWLPFWLLGGGMLLNTAYALRWALHISTTIMHEQELRRYDLLASLPIGALGTKWAISTGCLHKRPSFLLVPHIVQASAFAIILTMVGMFGMTLLVINKANQDAQIALNNLSLLHMSIVVVPYALAFFIDHLYASVSAVLLGISVTIDLDSSSEARMRALLSSVLLQGGVYALCALVALEIAPLLLAPLALERLLFLLLQAGAGIGTLLLLREWSVRALWAYITRAHHTEPNEIKRLLQMGR